MRSLVEDLACDVPGISHFMARLDSVDTPVGVQQKLMRHSDIRTTMNVYGDAATEEMALAHGKVVRFSTVRS